MVNYARIQHKIDKGLGIAGRHLGPPYDVYRVDSTVTGDFPDDWVSIRRKMPIFIRRTTDAKIQNALLASGTLWFDVIGNMENDGKNPFLLGDVFYNVDPAYQPGKAYGPGATSVGNVGRFNGFVLAWHAPVDEPVGARVDVRCKIYRNQGPPDVNSDGTPIWRDTAYAAQPLCLINGEYQFVDPYSGREASFVPAGVSSTDRPPRGHLFPPPNTVGDMQVPRYFLYMPPLPGYIPSEGDRIIQESGQRYVVTNPYYQLTGVVGMQLGVERHISED